MDLQLKDKIVFIIGSAAGISYAIAERFFMEGAHVIITSLLQRFAYVEEIANKVFYFASPLSSATNGASIRAEGGLIRSIF